MTENRRVSGGSSGGSDHGSLFDVEDGMRHKLKETDPHRLEQRQKAIDKGQNTKAYQNFIAKIPKITRPIGTAEDEKKYPRTPDKFEICSKRGWDGKVRAWRVRLHQWAPKVDEDEEVIQVPTAMTRSQRAEEANLAAPHQGKKRERDSNDEGTASKRLSLGGAGGKLPQQERPLRVSPLKERNERLAVDSEEEWPVKQQNDPKTIFDAWEEDEEEEIGMYIAIQQQYHAQSGIQDGIQKSDDELRRTSKEASDQESPRMQAEEPLPLETPDGKKEEGPKRPKCFLIIHSVAKRHNIGNLLRSATAFGVCQVCLIGSRQFNTFGSHGSAEYVSICSFETLTLCCQHLKQEEGCKIIGIEIMEGAKCVQDHPFSGPTAFILGNEYGEGTASLNVCVAASLVLHHFAVWAQYTERARSGGKFEVGERPKRTAARGKVPLTPEEISELQRVRRLKRDKQNLHAVEESPD